MVPPQVLEVPQANYPEEALEKGLEAAVGLALTIQADGTVTDVEVVSPAGMGFDEAAVEAVGRMRCLPATVDGEPTPVRITYTYRFELEEKPAPPPPEPILLAEGDILERGTRKKMAAVAVAPSRSASRMARWSGSVGSIAARRA